MKYLMSAICILLINGNTIFAQNISGIVIDEDNKLPIAFVNIGIAGKNIGTVSDTIGQFNLTVSSKYNDETLLFTCTGYLPFSIKIAAIRNSIHKNITLKKNYNLLEEIVVWPGKFSKKILGVITRSKKFQFGFGESPLGTEYGILMKCKKTAAIKKVNINIARCTFEKIFLRINIYNLRGKMDFENILTTPIYVQLSKDQIKGTISVDLQSYNIIATGDFLVTLEHVRDLGEGELDFCAGLADKTYIRISSQGKWETFFMGISISVECEVEE